MERPKLVALPGMAAIASVLAMFVIEIPVLFAVRDQSLKVALVLAAAAAALPLTFISVFFNVGFLKMVEAHLQGDAPTVSYGLRAARSRFPQILGWALLSASVGAVLRAIEELPVIGGWAGQLFSLIAGVAWSLATFFIVPVLALEGLGPIASVRRSAAVFRRRWGETVTGDIAIGLIAWFLIFPGTVLLVWAFIEFRHHAYALGIALGAGGVLLAAPASALSSALTDMFQYSLYREALGAAAAGPFTEADLHSGLKQKKRRGFFAS